MKKEEVRPQHFLDLVHKKLKEGEMELNLRKLFKIEELRRTSVHERRPTCCGQGLQSVGEQLSQWMAAGTVSKGDSE